MAKDRGGYKSPQQFEEIIRRVNLIFGMNQRPWDEPIIRSKPAKKLSGCHPTKGYGWPSRRGKRSNRS